MKFAGNASLGLVETKGLVGAIEAADAMVKASSVELFRKHFPGSAQVVIMCQGELSACDAAVTAGARAAGEVGELLCSSVIPRPEEGAEGLCGDLLDEAMQRKKERKRQCSLAAKEGASSTGSALTNASGDGAKDATNTASDGAAVEPVRKTGTKKQSGKSAS